MPWSISNRFALQIEILEVDGRFLGARLANWCKNRPWRQAGPSHCSEMDRWKKPVAGLVKLNVLRPGMESLIWCYWCYYCSRQWWNDSCLLVQTGAQSSFSSSSGMCGSAWWSWIWDTNDPKMINCWIGCCECCEGRQQEVYSLERTVWWWRMFAAFYLLCLVESAAILLVLGIHLLADCLLNSSACFDGIDYLSLFFCLKSCFGWFSEPAH